MHWQCFCLQSFSVSEPPCPLLTIFMQVLTALMMNGSMVSRDCSAIGCLTELCPGGDIPPTPEGRCCPSALLCPRANCDTVRWGRNRFCVMCIFNVSGYFVDAAMRDVRTGQWRQCPRAIAAQTRSSVLTPWRRRVWTPSVSPASAPMVTWPLSAPEPAVLTPPSAPGTAAVTT